MWIRAEMVIGFRRRITPVWLCVYPGTACQVPGHPHPQQAEPEDQKKDTSRLGFLRKPTSFSVCSKMMEVFCDWVVVSPMYFTVVCYLLLSCYLQLDSLQNMTGLMWLRPPVTLIWTNGGEWMDGLDWTELWTLPSQHHRALARLVLPHVIPKHKH